MDTIAQLLPATGELRLERLPTVTARTGLKRSEIYRRMAIGTFPKRIALGPNSTAWDSREITAWIEARIAERDAKAAA
jgi:prophage regulatory protein